MINICLNVILFVCMAYLMFFKDYIKKKGSNLADKQDIAAITHQIEIVKKEFTHENERLKANLQFFINIQLQQSNEERNAIITFYDYYSQWLNVGLLDIKFNQFNSNNIEDVYKKYKELNDFYTQTRISQNKISLLVNNIDIVNSSHKMIMEALKFNHWTQQQQLLALRMNLEENKRLNDRFQELIKLNPIPSEARDIAKKDEILTSKREEIFKYYYSDSIVEYKKIIKISNIFTEMVKTYLNNLGPISRPE